MAESAAAGVGDVRQQVERIEKTLAASNDIYYEMQKDEIDPMKERLDKLTAAMLTTSRMVGRIADYVEMPADDDKYGAAMLEAISALRDGKDGDDG